jgi:hypothetical protein
VREVYDAYSLLRGTGRCEGRNQQQGQQVEQLAKAAQTAASNASAGECEQAAVLLKARGRWIYRINR